MKVCSFFRCTQRIDDGSKYCKECKEVADSRDTENAAGIDGQSTQNAAGMEVGTTSSSIAIVVNGKRVIIENENGSTTTPSTVAFNDRGVLVGEEAVNQASQNYHNTVPGGKSLLGRKFDDFAVQCAKKNWPSELVEGAGGKPMVQVKVKGVTKQYTPEEITAMVLKKLKQTAEAHLGSPLVNVVISVPANFDDAQREAMKNAGKIAGLNVLRLVNETSLAAQAYCVDSKETGERNVVFCDMGGGTLDVSVATIRGGEIDVKAVAGNTALGGGDYTDRLVGHFMNEFMTLMKMTKKKNRIDAFANDGPAMIKLRDACEQVKEKLSTAKEATIEVDSLFEGLDFYSEITRDKFQELCKDLNSNVKKAIDSAVSASGLSPSSISEVIPLGRASSMPMTVHLLTGACPKAQVNTSMDPKLAVANGAAIQGAILCGDTSAAVGGGKMQLFDVVPYSLGVALIGDRMSVLIKRNSRIPTEKSNGYTTCIDNQDAVAIDVLAGESETASENKELGNFILTGIEPAPEGVPKIEVTFVLDVDGILRVRACDKKTGSSNAVDLNVKTDKGILSQEQIEEMATAMTALLVL